MKSVYFFVVLGLVVLLCVGCPHPVLRGEIPETAEPADGRLVSVAVRGSSGSESAKGLIDDPSIVSVTVQALNGSGEEVGAGLLSKKAGYWGGVLSVSETGLIRFKARGYGGSSNELYYGEAEQTIAGQNDHVTIPVTLWHTTWTERAVLGSMRWTLMVGSSDGSKLVACVDNGYVYTSTDGGAIWTEQTDSESRNWYGIASSSDGTGLAGYVYGGYIYTSIDSGASWTERSISGNRDWYDIASSSDGTKLTACVYNGYIYTSTDGGITWTERTASGSRVWFGIAGSSDGSKLAGCVYGGYIYTSN